MQPTPDLVGEILDRRFAVLEHTGPDRYRVYDMQALQHVELHVQRTAAGIAYRPAGQSPPPPPDDAERLEAAWFARGEELQDADESGAEVTDYVAYQAQLEELAARLPRRLFGASLLHPDSCPIVLLLPEPA
jgi:hypothetical protein